MSEAEHFENVVLGGGEADKYIAWELARAGRRTAVIERALVGGSCPNIACMPSKNVIRSAKVAELFRHAAEYGLRTGPATTDMEGVRRRKREMVQGMIAIHRTRFAVGDLEFVLGDGRFVAPKTVEVRLAEGGTRRLEGEHVFLNLGTHATVPDECAGSPQFTHVALDDFRVVRDNLGASADDSRSADPVLRLHRPRAGAGGPWRDRGRGPRDRRAGGKAGLPFTGLRDAILTHPTMAEGLTVLFANV